MTKFWMRVLSSVLGGLHRIGPVRGFVADSPLVGWLEIVIAWCVVASRVDPVATEAHRAA